jgi:predicted PilT family ATPase
MEILAVQAIALLTPYLVKGAEEITTSVAKDLWEKVKSIFKSKEKEMLLDKYVSSPKDIKVQGQIEYVIQEELENNSTLAEKFGQLIKELETASEFNSTIKQTGNENIAVGGQINNSTIKINKGN